MLIKHLFAFTSWTIAVSSLPWFNLRKLRQPRATKANLWESRGYVIKDPHGEWLEVGLDLSTDGTQLMGWFIRPFVRGSLGWYGFCFACCFACLASCLVACFVA